MEEYLPAVLVKIVESYWMPIIFNKSPMEYKWVRELDHPQSSSYRQQIDIYNEVVYIAKYQQHSNIIYISRSNESFKHIISVDFSIFRLRFLFHNEDKCVIVGLIDPLRFMIKYDFQTKQINTMLYDGIDVHMDAIGYVDDKLYFTCREHKQICYLENEKHHNTHMTSPTCVYRQKLLYFDNINQAWDIHLKHVCNIFDDVVVAINDEEYILDINGIKLYLTPIKKLPRGHVALCRMRPAYQIINNVIYKMKKIEK